MRCVRISSLFVFGCLLAVGCGGSGGSGDVTRDAQQPKHPDAWGTIAGPHGHSGGPVWNEVDEGHELYDYPRAADMADRQTRVVCRPTYKGTTNAGDSFEFEVTVGGEAKGTKELLYEGKKVEVELADGVSYAMEPAPR